MEPCKLGLFIYQTAETLQRQSIKINVASNQDILPSRFDPFK